MSYQQRGRWRPENPTPGVPVGVYFLNVPIGDDPDDDHVGWVMAALHSIDTSAREGSVSNVCHVPVISQCIPVVKFTGFLVQ